MAKARNRAELDIFGRSVSIDMLRRGYERVARNNGCAGSDGVTVSMFGFGLDFRLALLHKALAGGIYRPKPPAIFEVPKSGGIGKRVLRVPCVADRVAQSAANFVLQDILEPEFEKHSYAYRPGRSTKMALNAVKQFHAQGFHWVVDADIRAYFDNVPHTPLLARLAEHVPERRFLELVRLWLELAEAPGKGLPQGAPISPILANLYLDGVDEMIAKAGFRMVRYADDFVILCRSQDRADRALAMVSELLAAHELELNPDKTAIRALDEGYAFLGENVRGSTLARQLDQLGEDAIPAAGNEAGVEPEELTGALGLPGSRHIIGEVRDFGGAIDVERGGPRSLDAPWRPQDPVVEEEDEPPLPSGEDAAELRRKSRHAPFIRPLYIREKGRRLETHQAGFAVMEGDACLAIVAPGTIDRIDLFPGVDIGVDAMRQASSQGIPVFLCNGRGATQAVLVSEDRHRSRLHLAQARHALDPDLAFTLARRFVGGRIFNQRRLIQRLRGRLIKADRASRSDLDKVIDQLDYCRRTAEFAPNVGDVNGVRGVEARAGSIYWPALSSLIKRGFGSGQFKRTRRPPQTAFNAVLNFTAYLLRRDIETLLLARGLHPGFGVLHTVDDARFGLVFDLMEEFRAPVAEAVAALLLSTGELSADHFDSFPVDGVEAIHIVDGGGNIVVRGYERHVDNIVTAGTTGEKTTWRGAMDYQITRYIRHVTGVENYAPYMMDM